MLAASYEIAPAIAPPPSRTTVSVDELIVDEFIGSLNVTVIMVLTGTFVAPFAGLAATTVGAVSSRTVNESVNAVCIAFPATSLTPSTVTLTLLPLGNDDVARNSATLVGAV
jgi:hypothetical protein